MPNHIQNILSVKGNKDEVNKLIAAIKGDKTAMSFNSFLPIPKELEGTRSPAMIISKKDYEAQEKRLAAGQLTDDEKMFGISRGITEEMQLDFKRRFGADDWYGWQTANWGTKWDAYEVSCVAVLKDQDPVIRFQTAWSTPFKAMQKLSLLFPKVEITVKFADEDMGSNVGEYILKAGVTKKEYLPQWPDIKALEMAIEIWESQDYYFTDRLTEEGEEIDLSDPYYMNLVILANKNDFLSKDYPRIVLEAIKELCLREENYERMDKIQKVLDKKTKTPPSLPLLT